MSRIQSVFAALAAEGKTALLPFITAGDPHPVQTVPLMHALVGAGANMLELGVPFSDPMADGPVIQRASERALVHHVSLHDVLAMVSEFRKIDTETPVILMGYLNPVEVMGYETFASAAAAAGVDGVLTVDMPPEEASELAVALEKHQLDPIFLIAPTSTDQRIEQIVSCAHGFIYYVALKGVTGAANLDFDSVQNKLIQIRGHTDLPLGVGFGIKDAETAAKMSKIADAVVVGSALVSLIEANLGEPVKIEQEVATLIHNMRQAIDNNG